MAEKWRVLLSSVIERMAVASKFNAEYTFTPDSAGALSRVLDYITKKLDRLEFPRARYMTIGFIAGMVFMTWLDLTDLHICVGECDGAGYDLKGPRK